MLKQDFVLHFVIRLAPEPDRVEAAVQRAEAVWGELHRLQVVHEKTEPKPRASVDYVARMDEAMRGQFLAAWGEYNRVPREHRCTDRNNSAKAWLELAPDEEQAGFIVQAVKADAKQWRESPPAQSRKWFQGWLNERRWEAYGDSEKPAPVHPSQMRHVSGAAPKPVGSILADLAHWERLSRIRPDDPAVQANLDAIKNRMQGFSSGNRSPSVAQ
jgi:hypothetical protein